jgi:hypothetical protein
MVWSLPVSAETKSTDFISMSQKPKCRITAWSDAGAVDMNSAAGSDQAHGRDPGEVRRMVGC